MEKETISKLKDSLEEIRIKYNEYKKAKNKKEKESIINRLTILKNSLISRYDLMKYNLYIKSESYNTENFLFDVDNIILKLKLENDEDKVSD
ncbi:MAG: hypothetical protein O9297_10765 [Flavobacterium sp.]|jgi:hypothetical protein|uniref:hypothetical protein n=1 Tax=Flavobacterium sp. TaxID=239 RepID=UPI0022C3913A|nr:hypothetical protein [Flavobacterium sp.]MCZ8297685.1 hypothetical protein [Flavobacterium sp.]